MFDQDVIRAAEAESLHRWSSPWPGFTSGHDPRTSDNALLVQLHGSVEHAAAHDWQNAGRRLVDKTYVHMLWHVAGLLPFRSVGPERVAAALDPFVRGPLADLRAQRDSLSPVARQQAADDLVIAAAGSLFGSTRSEVAASRLLFYLCPDLPVFPLVRSALIGLELAADTGYRDFAVAMTASYRSADMRFTAPTATFGTRSEQQLISGLLEHSDWWSRRVTTAAFRLNASLSPETDECAAEGTP